VKRYILRRLALAVPTLFLVSVIVFALMRFMPGDVATRMVEGHAYAPTLQALRHDLGLDRPVHAQYLDWMGGILLHGDFGHSYWTRQPILEEFVRRFPVTLELALLTILVSVVLGIAVGILSAVRQDTASDYVGRLLAILALSVPYFGLAVLVVVLPSIYFKWTPVWTYVPFTADPLQNLKIMAVPALVFGVTRAGPIMRIMRSALLDVLRQDYIRTAWSKGLGERTVVLRHALKNAARRLGLLIELRYDGIDESHGMSSWYQTRALGCPRATFRGGSSGTPSTASSSACTSRRWGFRYSSPCDRGRWRAPW